MDNNEYLKNQVSILINLFEARRFEDLIDKGLVLIKKFPEQAIFYNITSLAYNAIYKSEEAKKILVKIQKKQPRNISVLNNLGLASVQSGEEADAEKYYNRILELKPDFLETLVNLGNLKTKQNKNEEAKKLFIKAIELNNKSIPPKLSLAGYYEQLGDFKQAKKLYNEILDINPNYTVADKSFSLINKYKIDDQHLKKMEEKLKKNIDEEGMRRLNFALGKAYEDIGDFEKSFRYYENGNKLYKMSIKYNSKKEAENFRNIKETFKNNFKTLEPLGQKIIFIVGMPRSGTTLTEQILSSHKKVYGAGELSFLKDGIDLIIKKNKIDFNAKDFSPKIFEEIRKFYLNKIKIFENTEEYLVDKAPLNFKWIGFIMAIFPNSKIIHCTRSPMDICWSNYKNTFSSRSMDYSYDFNDLSNFYRIYDDLVKFWLKKFDKNIFNMDYENLIINKERETKKLLKFCDLEWDNSCLDFHKNNRPVSTASLAQIRQPLYKTSVEKWKNYSKHLQILKDSLGH